MKGLVHTSEGWEFESDKRRYSLYEGICLDSDRNATSDLCFIMDDEDLDRDEVFVGYVWGASFVSDPNHREEWEEYIAEIVESYEKKQHMPNGIARLEHVKKIVSWYLETNEEVMHEDEEDIKELAEIKKDIKYLTTLIEKAKEMQR